jgi:hypothetical protein
MNILIWLSPEKIPVLAAFLCVAAALAGVFVLKRRGKTFKIRTLGGASAIEEAIGRATEMGKPVFFTSGTGEIDRMATLAALSVLGEVAYKAATYGTPLFYPNNDPVVASVAQEVVSEASSRAGHPEAFKPENVFFVTKSQFGYTAHASGLMERIQPAAALYFGTFEGESLILAETGFAQGAIQIAATDSTIQLAFFLVACDYTLIGEELFAAGGSLSGDQEVLSSIVAQDWLKAAVILLLLAGALLATFTTFKLAAHL